MSVPLEARRGGARCSRVLYAAAFWLLAGGAQAAQGLPDFTPLVQANAPAVVNVSTRADPAPETGAGPDSRPGPDADRGRPRGDWQRRHFEHEPRPDGLEQGGPESSEPESLGSGIIIESDGYIVTNFHVVRDAEAITVRLSDRRVFRAHLVGSDERSDLALLKIDAKGLPVVKIGHSNALKVGEWVFAIGSPFGFDHSVSVGVVSATGRSLPDETYIPFIQTDVAINPGNSGGPLFNLKGEVVGINSQIYSRTGGFMGLSFAIPVDVAMDVVRQLKTAGHVTRGWLGVLIEDVNLDQARSLGLDRPVGALVLKVLADSPAARAGIRPGDVVLDFAGHAVVSSSDLPVLVGRTGARRTVELHIMRAGKRLPLHVTLARLSDEPPRLAPGPGAPGPQRSERLNIAVTELGERRRQALGVAKGQGVSVVRIGPGPGRRAGLRRGDVILMLAGESVDSVAGFVRLAGHLPAGRSVPVLVQRRDGPLFLALKVDQ